jgi:hypothetical protein
MAMSVGSNVGGAMCDINTTPLTVMLLLTLILSLPIMTLRSSWICHRRTRTSRRRRFSGCAMRPA